MSNLPKKIQIVEEGTREGFQIEKGPIPTERKIELINALAKTGLRDIVAVSFVNPKLVPGMADAAEVVEGMNKEPSVRYNALCLNARGVERALATGKLEITGTLIVASSEPFLKRNQNKTFSEMFDEQDKLAKVFKENGVPVETISIGAVFGCNFAGNIEPLTVLDVIRRTIEVAEANGEKIKLINLADTMAWAVPLAIKKMVEAVRKEFPDQRIGLHLHDTRGMAIANAYAGLEMGVDYFDASVGGLGGCPFAGHSGAAGNVCTEDLVLMCDELGIETGIDLEKLIECAKLAEEIVGHPLPGSVMRGGSLRRLRERLPAAA
jgi:hydroxymethylglutaryl-CoA lyase